MGIQAVRFPGQSRAVTSSDTRRPFSVYTLMFLFVWKQKSNKSVTKLLRDTLIRLELKSNKISYEMLRKLMFLIVGGERALEVLHLGVLFE